MQELGGRESNDELPSPKGAANSKTKKKSFQDPDSAILGAG